MSTKSNFIKSLGCSTSDVTGSCFQLNYANDKVLIDCGFVQSSDDVQDYKDNQSIIRKIKAKEISAIVISHAHLDHHGLLPAVFAKGFTGIVYVPKNNKEIMRLMWYDTLKIMTQNAEKFPIRYNLNAKPFYFQEDIEKCYSHILEVDFDCEQKITNNISFSYYSANHIVNSAQILFSVTNGINTKKILYGCDLGNINTEYDYIEKFQPVDKCDIAIVETTYATDVKTNNKKHRKKDIEKIKSIVQQIQEDNAGRIIIPCFSLQRSADLLTTLYRTFANDKEFNLPIIYDAVLGNKINNFWLDVTPKNHELWKQVWNWDKIKKVSAWEDSVVCQNTQTPCIIIGSGGFCIGRATAYIQKFLSDSKTYLMFCGYSGGVNSIAYKIKHNKEFPIISLDGKRISNKAHIIELHSFSSHIDNNNMLQYYSDMNCKKIYLVHGQIERRLAFKPILENELSKKNKTTKVVVMNNDTKIFL